MDKVTVIQADRDAAAAIVPLCFGASELWQSNVRAGYYDDGEIVQAFAKHRLATPAPDSEKLREAVERVRDAVEADEHLDGIRIDHSDALLICAALGASL